MLKLGDVMSWMAILNIKGLKIILSLSAGTAECHAAN